MTSKERLNLSNSDSARHDIPIMGKNYVLEIWDNSNGLPQNAIFAMEKDNTGFLWMATEEGLARFDGTFPKVFDMDSYPEMLEQTYYAFFKTQSGIWASGDKSIAKLDKNILQVIDCSQITKKTWIRAISENENGELLIGTQNGKIYILENNSFSDLPFWNPESSLEIWSFFNLGNTKILVGTNQGLYEIDFTSRESNLVSSMSFSVQRIFGNSSAIYISSPESGIYRLRESYEMEKILSYEDIKDINPVSLVSDSENRIWAGSSEMGLMMIENGIVNRFSYPELKNYTVRKIIKEKDNLYLGTLGKGLALVKPAKVNQPNFEIFEEKNIKAIYQEADSSIWVGTRSDGIFRIKSGDIHSINVKDGLLQNGVITIGSRENEIFVGSSSGVSVINGHSGKVIDTITLEDGLKSNYVYAVYKDTKNWMWILTRNGGIHYINANGMLQKVDLPDNFATANFISISELKNKEILIGSMNQGIFRIKDGQFIENQTLPLTPGENIIYCIYEDEDKDLWLGTHGGMVLYSDRKFKALKKSHGLKSQSVFSITHDQLDGVWISNNFGVQYISNSELKRFKDNSDVDFFVSSVLYNKNLGMPNSEANGLIFPSALKDFSGKIWIPTVEGIGIVDPSAISTLEQKAANFLWDDLLIGNQRVPIESIIEIPPSESSFYISFTTIDFDNPDQFSFFYRINGESGAWLPIKDQRHLNFNSLKPGKYNLEVKVLRYGKLDSVQSLPIVVRAYFFETLTFKVLVAVFFLILIYFIVKYYFNIKMKDDLGELVNQRTLELSNSNEKLKNAISEIEVQNNTLKEITWNQSHLVRAPLTKAMGINQLLINYPKYAHVGKSREQLERELLDTLKQLDAIVRDTHSKSENLRK
ncbi:two-component regulator propeller domain-containing protein [Aquiflexum sp.]|uniref:ligand-binding sensor domain-containing protein n=1 Tax=Aquiflexum sp. TaxID=1872584 RepID=UPI0035932412